MYDCYFLFLLNSLKLKKWVENSKTRVFLKYFFSKCLTFAPITDIQFRTNTIMSCKDFLQFFFLTIPLKNCHKKTRMFGHFLNFSSHSYFNSIIRAYWMYIISMIH
jgi:hypothetical protein